ncbi:MULTISPECIES: hypothetical protein [Hydrocarboniphaga]|uniref:Uncharacterized protein n=1 Tax=Hydrocarboniphaga effusa AP103 TaxID=1172194 RepID=I8I5J7_9GAMM|nr:MULTISPECIES: hypothetical protein [Hydrocarboniphaga]EIT71761.1 hypothetical protein WQQ_18980 [Hydrocarboniphaga effusa AP103]MDZ4080384.1 hypothetical protein [Hydrocarboniphaga sp.]
MRFAFWNPAAARRKFRDRIADSIRKRFPELRIESPGDLDLVVALPHGGEVRLALERGYTEFSKSPSSFDDIAHRWLGAIADELDTLSPERALEALVAMIKSQSWLEDQIAATRDMDASAKFDLWWRPYNEELIVVLADFRQGIRYLHRSDVRAFDRPEAELESIGVHNLLRRTTDRSVTSDSGLHLLGAGGNLEASLLLDDDLLADHRLTVEGEALIGIPDRDSLIVSASESPSDVFYASSAVSYLFEREAYPLSRNLFVKRSGSWVPLDLGLIDESHPIPNPDVIDIHAAKKEGGTVAVMLIPSPLNSDPRSVFRLFRKLRNYLDWLGSASYSEKYGSPTAETTRIEVRLHPDSSPEISALLQSLIPWVEARHATLEAVVDEPESNGSTH